MPKKIKVGMRITWGTKHASYVIERIEGGRYWFVPGSGKHVVDDEGEGVLMPVCESIGIETAKDAEIIPYA